MGDDEPYMAPKVNAVVAPPKDGMKYPSPWNLVNASALATSKTKAYTPVVLRTSCGLTGVTGLLRWVWKTQSGLAGEAKPSVLTAVIRAEYIAPLTKLDKKKETTVDPAAGAATFSPFIHDILFKLY